MPWQLKQLKTLTPSTLKHLLVLKEDESIGNDGECGASVAVGASEGFSAAAGGTAFFIGPYAIGTGAVGAAIGGGVALLGC